MSSSKLPVLRTNHGSNPGLVGDPGTKKPPLRREGLNIVERMVGATGFEPVSRFPHPIEHLTTYESSDYSESENGSDKQEILYEIIHRWPHLSDACKDAVAALIRGAATVEGHESNAFRATPSKANGAKVQGGAQRTRAIPCAKAHNGDGGVASEEAGDDR